MMNCHQCNILFTIHFKKIHILNKISVDKWKQMIESLYESHTYNMWLADIVYHVASRYKKPHASLLNAKAVRQSFSWSICGKLSDGAQVECCPRGKAVEGWHMQPLHRKWICSSCLDWTHSCYVLTNSNLGFVQQQQKVFFSLRRKNKFNYLWKILYPSYRLKIVLPI